MSKFYQWILTIVTFIIAMTIIVFGIAGIAVAMGFLMIPLGFFYIARGVNNLIHKTKTVIAIEFNQRNQIIINPIVEVLFGILLLLIGVALTEAFIGIVITGIGIFLIVYYLDKYFKRT